MVIRKRETFAPVTTCAAMAAANLAGRLSLTGKGRGRSSSFASRTGRGEKDCPLWGNSSCQRARVLTHSGPRPG
jgi:hypothetical protein